jgi:hypothetical protein
MCFFNRIKTEDVYKMVRTKLLAWNTKGIPMLSYRNKSNYYESTSNKVEKKYCKFSLVTETSGLKLEFYFSYDKKTKEAWFRVFAHNLDLSYSKEGSRLIREKYKEFDFNFYGFTSVICKPKVCKTVQDCFKYLTDCMAKWNSCDIYNLLVDLNKLKK